MGRALISAAALAALLLGGSLAAAQDERPDPLDGPTPVDYPPIDLGAFELEIDPEQPVQHCVLARTDTPDGATVLVVDAVLTPAGRFAEAPRELLAVGPLADARPLECRGIAAEPLG